MVEVILELMQRFPLGYITAPATFLKWENKFRLWHVTLRQYSYRWAVDGTESPIGQDFKLKDSSYAALLDFQLVSDTSRSGAGVDLAFRLISSAWMWHAHSYLRSLHGKYKEREKREKRRGRVRERESARREVKGRGEIKSGEGKNGLEGRI